MKYRSLFALPAIVFLLLCNVCMHVYYDCAPVVTNTQQQQYILIDPGHGGEDGGATGCDGVLEKDVNLCIGNDLAMLLKLFGYPVRITRSADVSLATEGNSIRARKVSDMHNRLALYNAAQFTVSIHQNYFEQSRYSGAQLFCANTQQSKLLGTAIREEIVSTLQPENQRVNKTASGEIFLLHESRTPAVIVECGFLTNPDECAQLQNDVYQKQIAAAIAAGIIKFKAKEQ